LPDSVWNEVALVDDSVVALLSLDLKASGFADALDPALWSKHMQASDLYSENWLVAYEALEKGWLPLADGSNYVANDDFFSSLSTYDVEFYDTGTRAAATNTDWLTAYLGGQGLNLSCMPGSGDRIRNKGGVKRKLRREYHEVERPQHIALGPREHRPRLRTGRGHGEAAAIPSAPTSTN
jgi:hypothetical protein